MLSFTFEIFPRFAPIGRGEGASTLTDGVKMTAMRARSVSQRRAASIAFSRCAQFVRCVVVRGTLYVVRYASLWFCSSLFA